MAGSWTVCQLDNQVGLQKLVIYDDICISRWHRDLFHLLSVFLLSRCICYTKMVKRPCLMPFLVLHAMSGESKHFPSFQTRKECLLLVMSLYTWSVQKLGAGISSGSTHSFWKKNCESLIDYSSLRVRNFPDQSCPLPVEVSVLHRILCRWEE